MIPYCRHRIDDADRRAVLDVLDSDRITQGPAVERFEAALAERVSTEHAVAVSSGTSALQIALDAFGVGSGDEVLVPSLTFLATVNAVLLAGGVPVFVDVDPDTLSLDPEDLERKLTPRTAGAILVHYAGHVGDVRGCAERLGPERFLLEDACHALGSESGGVPAGSLGDAGCFSFHPAKHITTGEGGAVVTDDPELAERCRRLREHGMVRDRGSFVGLGLDDAWVAEQEGGWIYEMQALSGNHRLSDLSAALGRSQLARLDDGLARRRRQAERYGAWLADEARVVPLAEPANTRSAWHLYPIRLATERIQGGRAAVYRALHDAGIGVQVHYIPVHLQPFYRARLGGKLGDLPVTEDAYLRLLSLPLFPGLEESSQRRVAEVLLDVVEGLSR